MRDFVELVLGPVLVHLLNYVWRKRQQLAFWRRVEKKAAEKLADPAVPINDPTTATEVALLEEQATTVQRVARSVRVSIPPPMSSSTPSPPPMRRRGGSHSDRDFDDPGKSG